MVRRLSLVCFAVLCWTSQSWAALPFPFGDINMSGVVDAVDIQLAINAALGLSIPFDADLNNDSSVNAVDIQLVVNEALGISSGGPFKLTLILNADVLGSQGHNVWVFASNQGYTRASAPYNDVNVLVERYSASTEAEMHEYQFDAGEVITLVAFDGARSTFGSGNAAIDSEFANEFVMWNGDVTGGESTELGVASFAMTRNRVITAEYRRMPLIVISQSKMNDGGVGPGCTAISVSVSDYLSFPDDVVTFTDSTICGPEGVFLRGQLRTGSTVTVTAQPISGLPNLQFDRWEGLNSCGGDPTCLMTAGTDGGAECVWTGAPS